MFNKLSESQPNINQLFTIFDKFKSAIFMPIIMILFFTWLLTKYTSAVFDKSHTHFSKSPIISTSIRI